jgi:hypothetical protein
LGTGGPQEVKEHPYFFGVNWNSLLRQKAEFVPQIDHEEDTSYFDSNTFFPHKIYILLKIQVCLSEAFLTINRDFFTTFITQTFYFKICWACL